MGIAFDVVGFLLILLSIPLAFAIIRLLSKDDTVEFASFLGEKATLYAFGGLFFLIVVPFGAFVVLPLFVLLSFVSPAGRLDWSEYRNQRLVAGMLNKAV